MDLFLGSLQNMCFSFNPNVTYLYHVLRCKSVQNMVNLRIYGPLASPTLGWSPITGREATTREGGGACKVIPI